MPAFEEAPIRAEATSGFTTFLRACPSSPSRGSTTSLRRFHHQPSEVPPPVQAEVPPPAFGGPPPAPEVPQPAFMLVQAVQAEVPKPSQNPLRFVPARPPPPKVPKPKPSSRQPVRSLQAANQSTSGGSTTSPKPSSRQADVKSKAPKRPWRQVAPQTANEWFPV